MLSLLATSVIISQTVFSFLPVDTSFTARQAHTLAAYGALLIVALHLGLQWSMIMGLVRGRLGIDASNRLRAWVLRAVALGIAAFGVSSLLALNVASKLAMQVPMGFGDFQVSTTALFVQHLAVVGLGVCLSHYALKMIAVAGRMAGSSSHRTKQLLKGDRVHPAGQSSGLLPRAGSRLGPCG